MKRNLPIILFFTFLDFLALSVFFGTSIPLILDQNSILHINGTTNHAFLFGLTLLIFPIGQFLMGPFLGQLADNYGRRIILLMTLYGSCIGFMLMAYAINLHSFFLFILGRVISAAVSVHYILGQASLADTSQGVQRIRRFNLQFIAISASFLIGPHLIQWTTNNVDYSHAYWFIAVGYLLAFLLVMFFFKETLKSIGYKPIKFAINCEHAFRIFRTVQLRRVFLIWLIFQAGWNLFFQYSGEFLYNSRHMANNDINFLFSYVGFGAMLTQVLLVHPLASKIEPQRIIPWAIIAIGFSLFLGGLVPAGWILYGLLGIYCLGIGFFLTNFNTYVSNFVENNHQGKILAMLTASQALMNIITTFFGNFLIIHYLPTPFIVGGLLIMFSLLFWWKSAK